MSHKYIYVLRDHGQDLCDECKLIGDEDLEAWENFLNGEWISGEPDLPGFYPVLMGRNSDLKYKEVRVAKNDKKRCVWEDSQVKAKIKARWSLPLPFPPIAERRVPL